jgi:hypothetical protein
MTSYASTTAGQDLKAIETEYGGIRFRSRLEARWAVFFDTLGIRWEYEPEAYERQWDESVSRWLPDFLLPDSGTYVEVKGGQQAMQKDWQRLLELIDWGSPVPGINDSYGTKGRGVLLLGNIPRVDKVGGPVIPVHPIVQHSKGAWVHVYEFGRGLIHRDTWPAPWPLCDPTYKSNYYDATWGESRAPEIDGIVHGPVGGRLTGLQLDVQEAYMAARRYRFWNPS